MATTKHFDKNNTNFPLELFEYIRGVKWETKYDFLKYYQNIVRIFATSVDIGARGLIVMHQMGLGKSILAVSIAIDMLPRPTIMLMAGSLKQNMTKSIAKYIKLREQKEPDYSLAKLSPDELQKWIAAHFNFVTLNASNMVQQMGRASEGQETELEKILEEKAGELIRSINLNGKLLIVDEAHNFFRMIVNGGKNAMNLYKIIRASRDLKIIFLTGTPIANDPFEIAAAVNMLAVGEKLLLPDVYTDFEKRFIDYETDTMKNKNKFQNRLFGMISYVSRFSSPGKGFGMKMEANSAEFPEELPLIEVRVNMNPKQYLVYRLIREREKQEDKQGGPRIEAGEMTKPRGHSAKSYRVHSRQIGNYDPGIEFKSAKEPEDIPPEQISSAKFDAIYKNIEARPGQLGFVYSQYIGIGGLGIFARYLHARNWKEFATYVGSGRSEFPGMVAYLDAQYSRGSAPLTPQSESSISELETPKSGENEQIPPKPDENEQIPPKPGENEQIPPKPGENEQIPPKPGENEQIPPKPGENEQIPPKPGENEQIPPKPGENEQIPPKPGENEQIPPKPGENEQIPPKPGENEQIPPKPGENEQIPPKPGEKDLSGGAEETPKTIPGESADNIGEFPPGIQDKAGAKLGIQDKASVKPGIQDKASVKQESPPDSGANSATVARETRDAAPTYAIISGEVSFETRQHIVDVFDSDDNKHGDIINLLLISSTGAEGLDLKNVRHIHIMEPYWNWGRIEQVIARGVRNDSHISLLPTEKNVQPYVYIAVPPAGEKNTSRESGILVEELSTDEELFKMSISNKRIIASVYAALREVSIECLANGEANCRKCVPTGVTLYTGDLTKDLDSRDPCVAPAEKKISVGEVLVDGEKFAFTPNPESIFGFTIYTFDTTVGVYKRLNERDPRFPRIIAEIQTTNARAKPVKPADETSSKK